MSNPLLKNLLTEYAQKKLKAEIKLEEKLNDFYLKNPELEKINSEINRVSIELSKNILLGKNVDSLKNNLQELKSKKELCLEKLNLNYWTSEHSTEWNKIFILLGRFYEQRKNNFYK